MKQPDNFDFVQLNRKHPEILVSWAGQALVDRCRMTDVFEYVIMYYGTPRLCPRTKFLASSRLNRDDAHRQTAFQWKQGVSMKMM